MKKCYDNVTLGHGCMYSTDSHKTGVNNNVIVCGGSGAGKTMSIIEPRLLETFNSSLIVTVTKRRIIAKYKPFLQHREYDVQDLDFVRPQNSTIGFDPLSYVNSYSDISFLSESLVMADTIKDKSNADPYWDQSAQSLLSSIIAYVLTAQLLQAVNKSIFPVFPLSASIAEKEFFVC